MNCHIYRCGWCGNIVDEIGEPLGRKQWEKAVRIFDTHGHYRAVKINGNCCRHEFNY